MILVKEIDENNKLIRKKVVKRVKKQENSGLVTMKLIKQSARKG